METFLRHIPGLIVDV